MELETWYKAYCLECSSVNWLCDGNTDDLTLFELNFLLVMDIEGFKCYKCGHIEIFNINVLETLHDDKTIEEIIEEDCLNIVDGLEKPE